MKSQTPKDKVLHGKGDKLKASKSNHDSNMKKRKNMNRLGGGGLSLEAFANIKSNNSQYNPALIKKKKEFYKNAKYASKYKRSLKHSSQQNHASVVQPLEDDSKNGNASKIHKKRKGGSLKEIYEKNREEEERARKERDAIIQAKKEEREKAEARRKAERQKMLKKTRSGQPVMKYRIEHLLQTIQGSNQP